MIDRSDGRAYLWATERPARAWSKCEGKTCGSWAGIRFTDHGRAVLASEENGRPCAEAATVPRMVIAVAMARSRLLEIKTHLLVGLPACCRQSGAGGPGPAVRGSDGSGQCEANYAVIPILQIGTLRCNRIVRRSIADIPARGDRNLLNRKPAQEVSTDSVPRALLLGLINQWGEHHEDIQGNRADGCRLQHRRAWRIRANHVCRHDATSSESRDKAGWRPRPDRWQHIRVGGYAAKAAHPGFAARFGSQE